MKITRFQHAELARWQGVLRAEREDIAAAFAEFTAEAELIRAALNRAIARHNGSLALARVFAELVACELRDSYDGKTDAWKERDAGQAAEMMVSEWEDVRLEDVAAVEVLWPDPPHFEEGLNLPEESD